MSRTHWENESLSSIRPISLTEVPIVNCSCHKKMLLHGKQPTPCPLVALAAGSAPYYTPAVTVMSW